MPGAPDNLGILPTGGEGIALKKRAGFLEVINHLPYFLTALIESSFPFLYLHRLESFSPSSVSPLLEEKQGKVNWVWAPQVVWSPTDGRHVWYPNLNCTEAYLDRG